MKNSFFLSEEGHKMQLKGMELGLPQNRDLRPRHRDDKAVLE